MTELRRVDQLEGVALISAVAQVVDELAERIRMDPF
jgi:hypothetical protein